MCLRLYERIAVLNAVEASLPDPAPLPLLRGWRSDYLTAVPPADDVVEEYRNLVDWVGARTVDPDCQPRRVADRARFQRDATRLHAALEVLDVSEAFDLVPQRCATR